MGRIRGLLALVALAGALGIAPSNVAAADRERGQGLFVKHCSGCHGPEGRGAAKTFMPHVDTLTRKGYIDLLPDEYIVTVIAEGGPVVGKSGYMPAWSSVLSDQDIQDIVMFIRSLTLY